MKQYLSVLKQILERGVEKESGRENMPNTIGISKSDISMDLQQGFPLLTTKKMYLRGIIYELLWFLHGDTNVKYLVDNDVNIWTEHAYDWYLKYCDKNKIIGEELNSILKESIDGGFIPYTYEEFVEQIKSGVLYFTEDYKIGDLGKVYGYQWRNQNGVDQVKEVLDGLKTNPYSRYHIINAWNKADFRDMALPPCHCFYQFIVRPISKEERLNLAIFKYECIDSEWNTGNQHEMCDKYNIPKFYLDLNMYQRSCDTFLGVPFNIASMSLLLMIFAKASNMLEGVANWIGGDTHIYVDHVDVVKEQLKRKPLELPEIVIKKELNSLEDILELTFDDFKLTHYSYHPKLKGELFTGLKK